MKFADALKLMNDGNTITRNGKTLIKKGDAYRFTFADRLSRKWYVPPIYLEGISKYECGNCKTCQNKTQCPNSGYCYLWNNKMFHKPYYKSKKDYVNNTEGVK